MEDLSKPKKDSASGTKENSASSPEKDSVIARVVSYLKIGGKQLVQLKDPRGKKLGTVGYYVTVIDIRFTFKTLADARMFKKALKRSVNGIESAIIRIDTTDEGYIASEREVK